MIVTCPACSSRYKFDDSRLDGRSAKITCPTCDHVFVVDAPRIDPVTLKDTWPSVTGDNSEPAVVLPNELDPSMDLRTLDFSEHGVTLRVRQGLITRDYHSLGEVLEALEEGMVDPADELSVDGTNWSRIEDEDSLTARIEALHKRIEAGESIAQQSTQSFIIGDDDGDEDAPTMIVRTANLNLEEHLGQDEEPPPPPPAAPAFQDDDAASGSDDPETETVPPQQAPAATSATTLPAGVKAPSESGRSVLPIALLVLVVVAVIALILYTQGLIPGVGA